jgi:3-dehydroquinate dehydratase/shikimate dehydrogenase
MLFVSIARPEFIAPSLPSSVAVELRLDLFPTLDIEWIAQAIRTRPTLLTLRSTAQRTEKEREALIEELLSLEPDYFDLEWDMDPNFLEKVIHKSPKTKIVLSFHDFEKMPNDLEKLYRHMSRYPAFTYKIAALTRSTNEALKLLLFAKTHPKTSAICMGEKGSFGRVLGPVVGNLIDFACLDGELPLGPGQLSVSEFLNIYRYPSLNRQTAIYGLIGDPIEKSPGQLYHNQAFREKNLNAVYVKMSLQSDELTPFIPLAKEIGIRGLSVTIPLKEKVLPFVEPGSEHSIGALNTLRFKETAIYGTNTDGRGALDAIEQRVPLLGKKVVLLGAGGAARGIAFEAKKRGAKLLILNRTLERAKELAIELDCEAATLDEVPPNYDVLINSTSDPMPIDPHKIQMGTVVMDVVYFPRETSFLKEASLRGCSLIYGDEMFLNQAAGQIAFWIREGGS